MILKLCLIPQSLIIRHASRQLRIEQEKCYCQKKQIFDETNDLISCNYYDIDEPNKIHTKEQDPYIIQLNISSLSSHIADLKIYCLTKLTLSVYLRVDRHKRTL